MNIALVDFIAENERLDPIKSRRWLRLMRFVASRPQEAEITRRLTEAMYRTLRSVSKQIPLGTLLKAAAEDDTVIDKAESAEPWRDLMLRYRAEWLIFAEHARKRQLIWADLVMPLNAA